MLFENINVMSDKMCCLKALPYQVTKCVVWKHYHTVLSDKNVLFDSITLPYRVTKCVVWKHYPTIPSDKMCCLKALPYHTEWQNVLFESINLPSDKMCCLKALTYQVTKCVVWKHYPTIPSDKMCCLKALPYRTEWQNVLFESITLPYRVTKCVWKH